MAGRPGFVSVGVERRNTRLTSLRKLVPLDAAIAGIDLADDKQAVVISDHDARVLDRQMIRGNVWQVIAALPWAERVAHDAGFARIVLACEPTGSRWKRLLQHARDSGLELVCVNPMLRDLPAAGATLLASHNPDVLPEVPTDIGLTLSGHTHGEQVVLPGVGALYTSTRYGDRFLAGWVEGPARGYVSRGLRVSSLPVRINCPAELTILDLVPGS